MRPVSIINFERFYLGSMLVGLVNSMIGWAATKEMLSNDPAASGLGTGFMIGAMAFSFGITLLLWYFVARRASNVAKWILVVFFVLGLIGIVPSIRMLIERGPLEAGLSLVGFVCQAVAVYFLFRPDAKAWLESGGKHGNVDPDVFN